MGNTERWLMLMGSVSKDRRLNSPTSYAFEGASILGRMNP